MMGLSWWAGRILLGFFALALLIIGISVTRQARAAVEAVYGLAISLFGAGLSLAVLIGLARRLTRGPRL
jgi:hypothetical protein